MLRLLVDTGSTTCSTAAATLARFVRDDEPRQRAACDLDVMRRLSGMLESAGPSDRAERTRSLQCALSAVAALVASCDECRQSALGVDLAPMIVAALGHADRSVRVAAARCARGFSRSPRLMRRSLHDVAAGPVLARMLLGETDLDVLAEVIATVANLVVEYSPVKDVR